MLKNDMGYTRDFLDAVLRESTQIQGLPFSIGGVCAKHGTVYEGFACNEKICDPVDMDTIIWIASMTKAVTTTAIMQLLERGALSLKQKAGSILPELLDLPVLKGYDGQGKSILAPCEGAITVEQLLNHSSGFAYSFWNESINRYYRENGLPDTTSGSLKSLSAPLVRQPGTAWEYGISTDWLGLLLEKLTGMRLGEYLEKNILVPLNMQSTGFVIKDLKRLAPFYQLDSNNCCSRIPFIFPQNAEFHSGGAGLYSTVRDYLRFSRMLLNKGRLEGVTILRPETVALMFGEGVTGPKVRTLKGCGDSLDLRFYEDVQKSWGLCFMKNEETLPGGRSAGSQFWGGAANTYVFIDPKKELGGVFATQVLPFQNRPCEAAFARFEEAVYDSFDNF